VDRWTGDPFAAAIRAGYLYGRGASDMKTSVAAMVTAAERLVGAAPDHPGSVALLLTSDEEGEAIHGTAAVVDRLRSRGETIDACILGEPTSLERFGDTVKNGRRGSLSGVLRVKGVQGHIAYPERARNPIHEAVPALAELVATRWDEGTGHFPATSFQISSVQAGAGAVNVIPAVLEVLFNFRFSPESTVEDLQTRVKAILDRHGLQYELAWSVPAFPFLTPRGRLVEAISGVIAAVTGVTPTLSTGGGTSDGRFLAAVAREIVEFGPLADGMHGVDERVRVADIGPLSMVYERAISTLLTA
jgi:succinyl-diaminopimelate desuccinylase